MSDNPASPGRADAPHRRDVVRFGLAAALGWPVAATAQERLRKIGLLSGLPLNDSLMDTGSNDETSRISGFKNGLERLGWIEGRNIKYEIRSTYGGPAARAAAIKDLIDLSPDVLVTASTLETAALLAVTRTIPIVFATAADPVGAGFVESLARPGGNVTGFTNSHAEMGGKWLQFLKEADPRIVRIGVLFNPQTAPRGGSYFLDPIEAAASSVGVTVRPLRIGDRAEIDAAIASFAGDPAGGLVLPVDSFTVIHRQAVVAAAARHRLPAIYAFRYFIGAGGLMCYGAALEVRAAEYVNLILRGAKPSDLPVQPPRKYELVVNRPVAQALGLNLSLALLARADEIVE